MSGGNAWDVAIAKVIAPLPANIYFYFHKYYADPESLTNERYKAAQQLYEVQTAQSRYAASLGPGYRVVVVGQSPYPYDAEITRYLVPGQEYITICDPLEQPSLDHVTDKGLVFLFFPGNEQYRDLIREHYPRGMEGEMHNRGRAAGVLYVLSEAGSN